VQHWRIEDLAWQRFSSAQVRPEHVSLVKAAAMVERNAADYEAYLKGVFADDPLFCAAVAAWAAEEVKHGEALGRWAELADPSWDFALAFGRFRAGYRVPLGAHRSVRGSHSGELIARCMVEIGTSSYYTALAEATEEPLLREICHRIAADEFRHYKLFYEHLRHWRQQERLGLARRLWVALRRISESGDDELATAWHAANEAPGQPYERRRCATAYRRGAASCYRRHHVARGVGMLFKAVGLSPQGWGCALAGSLAWRLLRRAQAPTSPQRPSARNDAA
jgi:hypothetical protein